LKRRQSAFVQKQKLGLEAGKQDLQRHESAAKSASTSGLGEYKRALHEYSCSALEG
jgi:hypothetical protein